MCYECEKYNLKMPAVITENGSGILRVDDSSPKRHRLAVEKFAQYFQREMKYDFLQYLAENPNDIHDNEFIPTVSYLFTHPQLLHYTNRGKSRIGTLGAICFRKRRRGVEEPLIWEIDWIWIHPYKRGKENKSILKKFWYLFEMEFGNFYPSEPISKSLSGFFRKYGYPTSPKTK